MYVFSRLVVYRSATHLRNHGYRSTVQWLPEYRVVLVDCRTEDSEQIVKTHSVEDHYYYGYPIDETVNRFGPLSAEHHW